MKCKWSRAFSPWFEFITFDYSEGRALAMFHHRAISRTLNTKFRIVIHSLEICQCEISVSYHTITSLNKSFEKWTYSHIFTLLKGETNTYKTTMRCINVSNSSMDICVAIYSHTSNIIEKIRFKTGKTFVVD